jgi:hypothetical protein
MRVHTVAQLQGKAETHHGKEPNTWWEGDTWRTESGGEADAECIVQGCFLRATAVNNGIDVKMCEAGALSPPTASVCDTCR